MLYVLVFCFFYGYATPPYLPVLTPPSLPRRAADLGRRTRERTSGPPGLGRGCRSGRGTASWCCPSGRGRGRSPARGGVSDGADLEAHGRLHEPRLAALVADLERPALRVDAAVARVPGHGDRKSHV